MFQRLFRALLVVVFIGTTLGEDSCGCDGWVPFRDEKCFKIIDVLTTQREAQNICLQKGSILATIRTEEEQDLIKNYLKTMKIVNNIWIGMERKNTSFEWSDGTAMKYTYWAKGRPLPESGTDCAVISVDFISRSATDWENYGKWLDVNCMKKTIVLCEKMQPWSIAKLQKIVLQTRTNHSEELEILKKETIPKQQKLIDQQKSELATLKAKTIPDQQKLIEEQRAELDTFKKETIPGQQHLINSQMTEINNLKSNPVPIGFIYLELPGQPWPRALWPNTEWEHISPHYAGLFFRVEGGQSSAFGQIQEQSTQSLTLESIGVGFDGKPHPGKQIWHGPVQTTQNFFQAVYTGSNSGGDYWGIKLKQNGEEVRPRNHAIRIFGRIK